MKKILAIAIVALSLNASAQKILNFPQGAATAVTLGAGANNAITLYNTMSYVATVPTLTANTTIAVTAGTGLKAGATLLLAVKTTSTETTTFSGSIVAPVVTGVAGKTWTQAFIYNGTYFYPCGAKIQID